MGSASPAGTTSPSRAGGLCALRLVRAQLRGRGSRSRIPVGTVRSRLSRARARLQELDPGIGHEGERMQTIKEAVER